MSRTTKNGRSAQLESTVPRLPKGGVRLRNDARRLRAPVEEVAETHGLGARGREWAKRVV